MTHEPLDHIGVQQLISQAEALLALDERGVLVPHGIGGHARSIITALVRELSAAKSEPVAVKALPSDIVLDLQLLMESFCAYGGDAVPPSVIEKARTLHEQLSALASEPANG